MKSGHHRSFAPPVRTWAAFRRALRNLLHEHSSPSELGIAVFIGVFVGVLPIFGFHLLICLLLAWAFRLNKLALYGAANISNPLFAPLLITAELQLGHRILSGAWLSPEDVTALDGWREMLEVAAADLLVGSVVLGLLLGAAFGLTIWIWLWRKQNGREGTRAAIPPLAPNVERKARRFLARCLRDSGPRDRIYARAKLAMDPLPLALLSMVDPQQDVLDLGCGLGFLGLLRAGRGDPGKTHGVDWDGRKIGLAQGVSQDLPELSFAHGRLPLDEDLPSADIVVIADLLHYMDAADREKTLEQALAWVRPGGQLILRDMADSQTSPFHRFTEWFGLLSRQNRGDRIEPLDFEQLAKQCRSRGFSVRVHPFSALPVFSDYLLRAQREPSNPTPPST